MWTEKQDTISLAIPCATSFLTLCAGVVVCFSIFKSKKKFKNAYRRIIFVMTIFDLFISIGGIATPFRATSDISQSRLAVGNHTSAVVFTSMIVFGIIGSQMYNVSLSIYYLYVIKYNYRERKFKTVIEPYVHAIPILWALVGLVSCLATQSFNPSSNLYFITPYPRGCRSNDNVECTRGQASPILGLLFGTVTLFGTLIANVVIIFCIWRHVHAQEQKADRIRLRRVSMSAQNALRVRSGAAADEDQNAPPTLSREGSILAEALTARRSRRARSRRSRLSARNMPKMFLWRAFSYTVAFFVCYGTNVVVQILIIAGKNPATIPYGVRLWTRIIRPLHGFFNILLFTYPHIKTKLQEEPELSYLKALVKVIRSGCDADENDAIGNARNGSNTSSSHRGRRQRLLQSLNSTSQRSQLGRESSGNISAQSQARRQRFLFQSRSKNSESTLASAQTQSTRRLHLSTRSLFYETASSEAQSTRRLQLSTRSLFHENASAQSPSMQRLQSDVGVETITNNIHNDIEEALEEEASISETNSRNEDQIKEQDEPIEKEMNSL